MTEEVFKILTETESSFIIKKDEGDLVQFVKAVALSDTNFLLYPGLGVKFESEGNVFYRRSFASYIDSTYVNTSMVELNDLVIKLEEDIKFSLEWNREALKEFKIGIAYRIY